MKRTAIYVRVSQNREDDRAKPERQVESCRLLMKAKGLQEVAVFTDDDISAYKAKLKRPGYDALLTAIRDGEVDVVCSWHVDRMLRTVKEMVSFIELAEETKVRLESVQGGSIDLGTPAGRMMATILAAVAQAESELKAERHKLRNQHAAMEGKPLGGPLPFGWQSPAQASALKAGIKAYLAGDSLLSIARTWNEAGLTTTFGKPWNHDSVRKALIRPRNAGLFEHRGQIIEGVKGQWEPICSADEWRACKAISDASKRPFRPPAHLLTNLISCENGHKMVSGLSQSKYNGQAYSYQIYRCNQSGCRTSINAEKLDHHIRTLVRHRLTFEDATALAPNAQVVVTLKEQLGHLLAERKGLEDLLADRSLTAHGFKKAIAPIDKELTALSAKIEAAEAEDAFARFVSDRVEAISFTDAAKVGKKFDALDLNERRAIVCRLFPSITISKPGERRLRGQPMEQRATVLDENGNPFTLEPTESYA